LKVQSNGFLAFFPSLSQYSGRSCIEQIAVKSIFNGLRMAITADQKINIDINPKLLVAELMPVLKQQCFELVRGMGFQEQYLNREQTASLLGVSLPTLDKYTKKGVLSKYQLEGTKLCRYKLSDIEFGFKGLSFKK